MTSPARRKVRQAFAGLALLAGLAAAGCASAQNFSKADSQPAAQATPAYDPNALPRGPVGDQIRYGHDIIADTQRVMPDNITAGMSCAACHINAGTQPRGGSFLGTYARFPQWNKRSKRVIALQDRLTECFLYSMNGKNPPAYSSKEMIAMVAYIAWLSRGTPTGATQAADDRFIVPLPSASPDVARGGLIYAQKCSGCHQVSGAGTPGVFPPLWGPASFNNGAGMAHIDRMAGFIRYNMPQNAPGSLSLDESYQVAAFILTHDRPKFDKSRLVVSSPVPAGYF